MLTLGYVVGKSSPAVQRKTNELAALVGRLAEIEIGARAFETYDDLTQSTYRGEIDLAWLPPVSFLVLVQQSAIVPLAAVRALPYKSAFIVAPESPLQKPASLVGKHAAWVDRHSASGYVVPRLKLARLGIDLGKAFASEKFYGTHDAVAAAVVRGDADFGATWVRIEDGKPVGPWARTAHEVRILATFGAIPPDMLAARADLAKPARKAIVRALKAIYEEKQSRWLVTQVLGTQAFYRPRLELYGPLQEMVIEAYANGLLGAASIAPPPPPKPKSERHLSMRAALASQPRIQHDSVVDVIDDAAGAEIDSLLQSTENPRWTLPEIDVEVDIE